MQWMDSSTQSYCENMEKKIGGPQVGFKIKSTKLN